jgi:hypothetical protein
MIYYNMGSGFRLASRIYTNSFAGKNREMAFPFIPNNYFGFQNRNQYAYNVYHQLADNGAGFGARGARWARANNVPVQFIPSNYQ